MPWLLAFVAGACAGPARPAALVGGRWAQVLDGLPVAVRTLPAADAALALPLSASVMVVAEATRPGDLPFTDQQRRELRQFAAAGGRVLLLGHAAALVASLGIETEWPEASVFRWGYDARAVLGRARLGVQVVSGRAPELFEALQSDAMGEQTFFLAGGAPCTTPLCQWSVGAPARGTVLARVATELDGEPAPAGGPVVVHWQCGRGDVLACGLLPAIDHDEPRVRDNARAFVRACGQWLQRGREGPVVLLRQEAPVPAVPVRVQPPFAARSRPQVPLLSHWGWQASLRERDADAVRTPQELVADVLLPSWLQGADVLELALDLGGGDQGVSLAWPADDPLKPPASWRAPSTTPVVRQRDVAELAGEAHARGMFVAAALDRLPVGDRKAEQLVALRFLARELGDARRLGPGAVDGFGIRSWWRDGTGLGSAMVQDFHPGAFLYGSGECAGELAGGMRALDADDGAPRGSPLAGISGAWRDGFAADEFPLGVLDARAHRLGEPTGGGAHGDWIVTQANDFVRDRRGIGGALWWRRHDPAAFDPSTVAYVHGVSQEPLVAAVAMSLAATGRDGRRAAAAALLDPAPPGFGAESTIPSAVHVLQNNWFSLAGSGGRLAFDRDGLARFRDGEPLLLSPSFLRTRIFGARPDGALPGGLPIDLLAGGRRGEGGYGRIALVGADDGDRRVPAVIAAAELPAWPVGFACDLAGDSGYHELRLHVRPVRGVGVVVVSLDGVPMRSIPFRDGARSEPVVVPVHRAGPGVRTLQIEVADGGAAAIDVLALARAGEVSAEARVQVPAGSLAELHERSHSTVHAERVSLRALADFPGFVAEFTCERAARGLQVERTFLLPAHTQLAEVDTEAIAGGLRRPFVLRGSSRDVPDVVVVPLRLQRHERFVFGADGLVLRQAPEATASSRVGFLFCDRALAKDLVRFAATMLEALANPMSIDLGTNGEATIASELPMSWTRVVQLAPPPATPCLVRENGWWTWRAVQPAAGGGAWLRLRHEPGDTVQVVAGPAAFARTRPGPGSLRVVALRDPEPLRATACVVQPSLLGPPSVVMGQDFDEVQVDGQPWAWFDGRTVFLPDRPGTYRIECRTRRVAPLLHVRTTRAPLARCTWDPERRALVLVVPPLAGRPVELPWTAVLAGPRPTRVENGEIVDEAELRHADAEAAAAARAGGTLIRFRSGVTEVFP